MLNTATTEAVAKGAAAKRNERAGYQKWVAEKLRISDLWVVRRVDRK